MSGKPPGKAPVATMPAVRHIETGGVVGYRELSVDRYAASASPDRACLGKPHMSQQLRTDRVSLRKTSCDRTEVATPTYDRIVRLLNSYTGR